MSDCLKRSAKARSLRRSLKARAVVASMTLSCAARVRKVSRERREAMGRTARVRVGVGEGESIANKRVKK